MKLEEKITWFRKHQLNDSISEEERIYLAQCQGLDSITLKVKSLLCEQFSYKDSSTIVTQAVFLVGGFFHILEEATTVVLYTSSI